MANRMERALAAVRKVAEEHNQEHPHTQAEFVLVKVRNKREVLSQRALGKVIQKVAEKNQ